MKRSILFLIVFVLISSAAYGEECGCITGWAMKYAKGTPFYAAPGSDAKRYRVLLDEAYNIGYGDGNYLLAIDKCKKAIEIEDCLSWPFVCIGNLYLELGQKAVAMEYFKRGCDRKNCNRHGDTDCCDAYKDLRMELLGY